MKIFKAPIFLLTLYLFSISWIIEAKTNNNSNRASGSHTYQGIRTRGRDVFKRPNFRNSWILDMKLATLKEVGILGNGSNTGKFDFIQEIFRPFKDLPESISRIHMYGNGKTKNTTMLIFGNVDNAWLEEYIVKHLYNDEHSQLKYTKKILTSGLKDITKLTIQLQDENQKRSVYFSTVKSGMYVISSNIIEVRRWGDYPRSIYYYKFWPDVTTLLSLQIVLEPTLKNLQKDLAKDDYMLQSKIFKNSKDINIAIKESGENVFAGAYITTNQLSQVEELKDLLTNMLVATNLDGSYGVKKTLLENLTITKDKKFLKLGSFIPKSELKNTASAVAIDDE